MSQQSNIDNCPVFISFYVFFIYSFYYFLQLKWKWSFMSPEVPIFALWLYLLSFIQSYIILKHKNSSRLKEFSIRLYLISIFICINFIGRIVSPNHILIYCKQSYPSLCTFRMSCRVRWLFLQTLSFTFNLLIRLSEWEYTLNRRRLSAHPRILLVRDNESSTSISMPL